MAGYDLLIPKFDLIVVSLAHNQSNEYMTTTLQ